MVLLDEVRAELRGPVWINADILPGPGGKATPLDPKVFLEAAVTPGSHGDVLSLGWTTGWTADTHNPGELPEHRRAGVYVIPATCRGCSQSSYLVNIICRYNV